MPAVAVPAVPGWAWEPVVARPDGGWMQLYHDHVGGADTGADLDFLKGCRGKAVGRDSH